MRNTVAIGLFLLIGLSGPASAQFDDDADITRSLIMRCEYYDHLKGEDVTVARATADEIGDPAATKRFRRSLPEDQSPFQTAAYRIKPGQMAECIFPSGHRIRVKAASRGARAYGMCGADPQLFMSMWVNGRKVVSRTNYAGRCWDDYEANPAVSFKYSAGSLEKCQTVKPAPPEGDDQAKAEPGKPVTACVDYPELARFPSDDIEYPPPGKKMPAVGELVLLSGSHDVCAAAREELTALLSQPAGVLKKLGQPEWQESKAQLPEHLQSSAESVYDFDNDGKLDRVFSRHFEMSYMDGSVLLVQLGGSVKKLSVSASPLDKRSWFIPCQLDGTEYDISNCPLFSQAHDDASFRMNSGNKNKPIYFSVRYMTVDPFLFGGHSFVVASSTQDEPQQFYAILKPLPHKKFKQMCLLRRIPENF